MATKRMVEPPTSTESDSIAKLRRQYGCGPIEFAGTPDALYERHLVFDNVVDLAVAGGLEQRSAVKKPGVTLFIDVPALLAGRETEVT